MKYLLPFYDDSTLIFASVMQDLLRASGHEATTVLENGAMGLLSERQVFSHLPQGPDVTSEGYLTENDYRGVDAVVVCKSTRAFRDLLSNEIFKQQQRRPAFVAFQPGLEFTPEKGMRNRKNFDIVFLNTAEHLAMFDRDFPSARWRHAAFGHPYFVMQDAALTRTGSDIVFFAQAISPATFESRRFILDILCTLAEANPDRKVVLKLRHLRTENVAHAHRELFDYQTLLEDHFPHMPSNLHLSSASLSEAVATAGLCITCTSSAAMETIARGIPTMIYLDYPEYYLDPLASAMRVECAESGLIASLPQVLHLAPRPPRRDWLQSRFREKSELVADLDAAVTAFHQRLV